METITPRYQNDTNPHSEQQQQLHYMAQPPAPSSFLTTPQHDDYCDRFQSQEELHAQQQQQQQISSNDMDILKQQNANSHECFLTTAGQVDLMPEPPPYEDFKYEWAGGFGNIPLLDQPIDFGQTQQLFEPEEANFIFDHFLGNLEGNPNYIFNPELPPDLIPMPKYVPTNESDGAGSSHAAFSMMDESVYSLPGSDSQQLVVSASNSTSLSPRTRNLALSSSPKQRNPQSPPTSDETSHRIVPAKRKQVDEEETKSSRRSSNPRLTPINTKIVVDVSLRNVSSSVSRPSSPSLQLSGLSINTGNGAANGNSSSYDSNNDSAPTTPNLDLTKAETLSDDNSDDGGSSSNAMMSSVDIKSESKDGLSSASGSKSSRKPYKELLTEEEKRANHIASEQKRRNTIRAGFKELTDIIPTLKNVNNSKSTILFKAVDYIKYLERRNRNLKERAGLLEMRVEMEIRSGNKRFHHHPGAFGPALGFGHNRVAQMQIGSMSHAYGVIPNGMNGMGIPLALSHPGSQQHVLGGSPHQIQNIYFNHAPSDNPQMMNGGVGLVSPITQTSNNIFSRSNGSIQMPQSQQQHHHDMGSGNSKQLGAMSIPANIDESELHVISKSSIDGDGDSSMMNGNVNVGSVVVKG